MDRGNILSGGAFRVTVYATLVLVVVAFLTAFFGHRDIEAQQLREIRDRFEPVVASFQTVLANEGEEGFLEQAQLMVPKLERMNRLIAVFDASGTQVAGSVPIPHDFDGWATVAVQTELSPSGQQDAYLFATTIGARRLVIGSSLAYVEQVEAVFVRSVILVTSALSLLFVVLGYVTSRSVQIKLERIDETLQRFSDGQTDARLELSAANDQIDRVSHKMNVHLNSLDALMTATQTSAAAIAHDLKRPLARAMLGLESALDQADAGIDPQATLVTTQKELTNLSRIFETILRISRIQHLDGGAVAVDLAALFRDIGETYMVVAEESGQSLRIDVPEGDFTTRGDAGMLSQMLVNLLQNAVTYGPPGNQITVSLRAGPVLTVCDTGPGIAEADRDRVLTPFFRADAARTTEGNGLGLALVKSVTNRHGAMLTLSDNAPGLCVTIRFAGIDQT